MKVSDEGAGMAGDYPSSAAEGSRPPRVLRCGRNGPVAITVPNQLHERSVCGRDQGIRPPLVQAVPASVLYCAERPGDGVLLRNLARVGSSNWKVEPLPKADSTQ